jgi:hypothetical protein
MFWRTGCVGCGPICGGRRGRSEPEASPGGEVGGGARTGVLRRWSLSERRQWRPEPPRPVPAKLEAAPGAGRGRRQKHGQWESAVPVTATRHCPVPVLPRRAKTSFPGREAAPLRFAAPFRPGVPRVCWTGLRSVSASAVTLCWRGATPPSWLVRPHSSHTAHQHTQQDGRPDRQRQQPVSGDLF